MSLKDPARWSRVLSLCGLILPIACQSNPTEPVPGRPAFVLLAPGTVAQVSAGGYHTCALRTDGSVACWGDNSHGQATPPAGTFTQVSAGGFHTCGLRSDSTVACWGSNLGARAPYGGQATPPVCPCTQVSAGGYHTCGLKPDGSIACWGENSDGQATPPGDTLTQVSAVGAHSWS